MSEVLPSATGLMESRSKPALLTSLSILLLEAASQAQAAQTGRLAVETYQQRLPLKKPHIKSRNVSKGDRKQKSFVLNTVCRKLYDHK